MPRSAGRLAAIVAALILVCGSARAEERRGVLEGQTPYFVVEARGDFGIGTFGDLDGEMLAVDGAFYQIKSDGHAYPVEPSLKTPFASVTYFDRDFAFSVPGKLDYPAFLAYLDGKLPTKNVPYAVRVEGTFEFVKTRSVPRQSKPYPKLAEVVKTQPVFEFKNVKGTLVGFRFPDYMRGVNVPGYHFHFITADKTAGGHVLELTTDRVDASLDASPGFSMRLPETEAFDTADLSADGAALDKVEK